MVPNIPVPIVQHPVFLNFPSATIIASAHNVLKYYPPKILTFACVMILSRCTVVVPCYMPSAKNLLEDKTQVTISRKHFEHLNRIRLFMEVNPILTEQTNREVAIREMKNIVYNP